MCIGVILYVVLIHLPASVFLAFATFIAAIVALIFVLVPQLVTTITDFVTNAPEYQVKIHAILEKLGATSFIHIPESADEIADQAVDLLAAKATLKRDFKTLLSALLMDDKLSSVLFFVRRCNFILNRYLVFTLLDALIVGVINAIIMLVLRMPYVGMISVKIAFKKGTARIRGTRNGDSISGWIMLPVGDVDFAGTRG